MSSWNAINDLLEDHEIRFNCAMLDCRSQEFYIAQAEEFGTRSTAKTAPVLVWQTPLRERPVVDALVMHQTLQDITFARVRGERFEEETVLVFDKKKSSKELLEKLKVR